MYCLVGFWSAFAFIYDTHDSSCEMVLHNDLKNQG